MADSVMPVLLNQGLDASTPPMLTKPGTLIDCLNYEMTGEVGYRRIDGYERFDGYPTGNVSEFYIVTIVAVTGSNQQYITAGSAVSRKITPAPGVTPINGYATNEVGIIVESKGSNAYAYVPYDDAGTLKSGEVVTVTGSNGSTFDCNVTVTAVRGNTLAADSDAYLASLRQYSSVLRNAVQDAPGEVVGIWVLKNYVYLAISAPEIDFTMNSALDLNPIPGSLMRYNGVIYRVIEYAPYPVGTSPIPARRRISVMPVGTVSTALPGGVSATGVIEVTASGTTVRTLSNSGGTLYTTNTAYCYVVRCNTATGSNTRGFTALAPSYRIPFDAGTYTTESLPLTGWTIRTTDGSKTINAHIVNIEKTSGTFVGNNAVGYVTVSALSGESGGSCIDDDWELWYGGSRRMTVNTPFGAGILGTQMAGKKRLEEADTRYQTVCANFYGNARWRTIYGATGASRAFWADHEAFGSIYTMDDSTLDQPKYVAYHAGRLALGYEVGSVLRSEVGNPLGWSGILGAEEIATGDQITGLVEVPGDSLIVFGRQAIRRLAADGTPTTISSGDGAFDYTACMVGQSVMFTGVRGISTLEQSASYGDFEGTRASGMIHNYLRPRLLVDNNGFETGGVAMAIPVRNKNQYRLFLKNGQVIFLTTTSEGYKATKVNYAPAVGDLRVPFAWSSAVADNGKEYVHVVWDSTLASRGVRGVFGSIPESDRVYELDSGWGFDGVTFEHYFDTTHLFAGSGANYCGIEKVRLHGQGYGRASLNLRAAGIEDDYDAEFSEMAINISLPKTSTSIREELSNFTSIAYHSNWGLGVKLRIEGSQAAGLSTTEPSHICQVLVLHVRSQGAQD